VAGHALTSSVSAEPMESRRGRSVIASILSSGTCNGADISYEPTGSFASESKRDGVHRA